MKTRIACLLGVLFLAVLAHADAVFVISSSPAGGAIFSPSPVNVTEAVTFNMPLDPNSVSFNLLDPGLHSIAAASDSFDSTATMLTVNYLNLATPGTYDFIISAAENFNHTASLPSPFSVAFSVDHPGFTPTPEPSSLLLLGSGLAARAGRRAAGAHRISS
jgi:hypothetical protein